MRKRSAGGSITAANTNKTLSQNTVTVNLSSHGDRVVVMEEILRRDGEIAVDDVQDDY